MTIEIFRECPHWQANHKEFKAPTKFVVLVVVCIMVVISMMTLNNNRCINIIAIGNTNAHHWLSWNVTAQSNAIDKTPRHENHAVNENVTPIPVHNFTFYENFTFIQTVRFILNDMRQPSQIKLRKTEKQLHDYATNFNMETKALHSSLDIQKIESLNGNDYKIWRFDATKHLFVSIIVIPRSIQRYENSINVCNKLQKQNVTCQLFVGFDAINKTRNEICNAYPHWIEHNYCFYNATTIYKLADIVSKMKQFNYILNNVFTNKTQTNENGKDYKYYLMLEDDAMINDDFGIELNKYVNRLIDAKIRSYMIEQASKYLGKNGNNNETITGQYINSIVFDKTSLFYKNHIANLSRQLSQWMETNEDDNENDSDSNGNELASFISNTFDILQLHPNWWCWEKRYHFQTLTYSDNNANESKLYYYSDAMRFSLTTALIFRKYAIEYIMQYMPMFDNSDVFMSYLMHYPMTYPRKPIKTYAVCPCIVGDIGGNSSLGTGVIKPIRPPGWQYSKQEMKQIVEKRRKEAQEKQRQMHK